MRKITFLFTLLILSVTVQGQFYNFDNVSTGQSGILPNGWTCNPSFGYRWASQIGSTTVLNTGPQNDHTTGMGTYMFTNTQSGLATDVANLESPNINLASYTNPGLSFWYHKTGFQMGDMYIDVFSNNAWINGVDSVMGVTQWSATEPWKRKLVNLNAYSGIIKVRFRGIKGNAGANSNGHMAIDDVGIIEMPAFDGELIQSRSVNRFYSIPTSQVTAFNFLSVAKNAGTASASNFLCTTEIAPAYNSSSTAITSAAGNVSNHTTSTGFTPTATGVYNAKTYVSSSATDTVNQNDTLLYQFEISDSIMARERGNFVGGIGFTGATGYFGQMFELTNTDTLTSIQVNLRTPTIGDSIKFYIFGYANGVPTTIIDSSDIFVITSNLAAWYTVNFTCDLELTPGQYFVAARQMNTNNLSFAFSIEYYEPSTLFYSLDAVSWIPFENAGFRVTLGMRLVFGDAQGGAFTFSNGDLGNDTTYCPFSGFSMVLDAYEFGANYSWNTNATSQTITVTDSGTYIVTVSKCGISVSDTLVVSALPYALVNLGNDTAYCPSDSLSFSYNFNTPGASYSWNNGDTSGIRTINQGGFYWIQSVLGQCVMRDTIVLTELPELTPLSLGNDTAYCVGQSFLYTFDATNTVGASYTWNDNSTSPTLFVNGPGTYSVTVSLSGPCPGTLVDSVTVIEAPRPTINLNDTFFCIPGEPLILNPSPGNATYNWSNGSTDSVVTINTPGLYALTVTSIFNCTSNKSAQITSRTGITVNLGPDLTDTEPVTLDAGPGYNSYLWITNETTQTITAGSSGTYWVKVGNNESCFASDTVEVMLYLGIGEKQDLGFVLYPNPSNGIIHLSNAGKSGLVTIQLFDLNGRIVFEEKTLIEKGANYSRDFSNLTTGTYVFRITQEDAVVNHKWILQR